MEGHFCLVFYAFSNWTYLIWKTNISKFPKHCTETPFFLFQKKNILETIDSFSISDWFNSPPITWS